MAETSKIRLATHPPCNQPDQPQTQGSCSGPNSPNSRSRSPATKVAPEYKGTRKSYPQTNKLVLPVTVDFNGLTSEEK
jgi:hypothetical protein